MTINYLQNNEKNSNQLTVDKVTAKNWHHVFFETRYI